VTIGELRVVLSLATQRFNSALSGAQSAIMSFKNAIGGIGAGIGQVFSKVAETVKRVGIVSGIAFTGAIIAGARFEDAMNRTFAIISSGGELAAGAITELTDEARRLGRETLYSSTQAAMGMQKLALAGFSVGEIKNTIGPVLNMAIVGNMDLADATDVAITSLKSFQMEASDAAKVADVLAKASTSANVTVGSLGEALKYSAAVANAAGWSMEELSAMISQMGNAGFQGSQSGTALRRAISMMLSPTNAAQKVMEKYGLTFVDAAGKLRPLIAIIGELSKANVSAADMFELFGLRAAPAMTAVSRMGVDSLSKLEKKLKSSAGTADKMSQKFRETIVGRFKDLMATLNEVSITITQAFGTSIADALFGLRNWLNNINSAIQENDKLKAIIDGLKEGLAPLIARFKEIGDAVVDWIKGLSPEELKEKFKAVGTIISNVALSIINVLGKVGQLIGNVLSFDTEKAKASLETLRDALLEVFRGVAHLFVGAMASGMYAVGPIMLEVFKAIIDAVGKMFATGIYRAMETAMGNMAKIFGNIPFIGQMFKDAEKDMAMLANQMEKEWMGISYADAIVKGMEEAAKQMPQIFEKAISQAGGHFQKAIDIVTPTGPPPTRKEPTPVLSAPEQIQAEVNAAIQAGLAYEQGIRDLANSMGDRLSAQDEYIRKQSADNRQKANTLLRESQTASQ
jgi:TP901 family phage tail tape measure protein